MKMSFKLWEWECDIPIHCLCACVCQSNWTIIIAIITVLYAIAEMRNAFSPMKFSSFSFSHLENCFWMAFAFRAWMFGHGPRPTGHSIDTGVSHHCITPIGFSFRLSKLQQALHYRIIFITKWIFDSTEDEHIRAPFQQVLISIFTASSLVTKNRKTISHYFHSFLFDFSDSRGHWLNTISCSEWAFTVIIACRSVIQLTQCLSQYVFSFEFHSSLIWTNDEFIYK